MQTGRRLTQNGKMTNTTLTVRTVGVARAGVEEGMTVTTGSNGVGACEVGKDARGPPRRELIWALECWGNVRCALSLLCWATFPCKGWGGLKTLIGAEARGARSWDEVPGTERPYVGGGKDRGEAVLGSLVMGIVEGEVAGMRGVCAAT